MEHQCCIISKSKIVMDCCRNTQTCQYGCSRFLSELRRLQSCILATYLSHQLVQANRRGHHELHFRVLGSRGSGEAWDVLIRERQEEGAHRAPRREQSKIQRGR